MRVWPLRIVPFLLAPAVTGLAFADETNDLDKAEAPILWGFASYGFYSGY